MLRFVIYKFECDSSQVGWLRSELTSYLGLLVSRGYLARKSFSLHEQDDGTLELTGIASAPDCIADAQSDPRCRSALDQVLQSGFVRMTTACGLASTTLDERYCDETEPARVRLVCDCLLGVSPFRSMDGGFIARYKLRLPDELSDSLWAWDNEYDHIYNCWLISGSYEKWAEKELKTLTSVLNRRGVKLAQDLSRACGIDVDYTPTK